MGLFKDIVNVASKVADTVDDIAEATGVKGVAADVAEYADETFDEIKEVMSTKGEKE